MRRARAERTTEELLEAQAAVIEAELRRRQGRSQLPLHPHQWQKWGMWDRCWLCPAVRTRRTTDSTEPVLRSCGVR